MEPHGLNLDGIFGVLTNVVWTSHGPCPVEGFEHTRLRLRARGPVAVYGIDKFPGWSTTWYRPGCASPTPTGCGWARTWRPAPP